MNEEQLNPLHTGYFPHECMKEGTIEDMKVTIGAMERSISDMEKRTGEILDRLEKKLDSVTEAIENNGITVKVLSNGLAAQVKLGDIIQFFLDRPMAQMKKAETVLNRVVAASRDIVWIFGAVLVIIYTLSSIMHLPRP